ncbi:MAG: ATP-dependent helicase [Planctomycetota bacterium]|jgi:DNA helicase-2/ATP-dependent DNA helicase PcrA
MQKKQLEQLTRAQKKAIFHVSGPLLVLAGPGSGKTRVITNRIAALIETGIKPWNICAITFTNKAAQEMRQRVFASGTASGAHISTFHSLCVWILRRYPNQAKINSNFSIYDTSEQRQCIKRAVKDCNVDTKNFPPAKMLAAVSTLKNQLLDPVAFERQADSFFEKSLVPIYLRYQQVLDKNNALDFDDLLFKTARLLQECPDVRSQLSNRFKFVLIDEYQDTNHSQYQIAKLLVADHSNICATGDPDQSIYRWRGADIKNILDFETDWPTAKVVRLEENFRSTPNILAAADSLIAVNQSRKQKKLVPTKAAGNDVIVESFQSQAEESLAIAQQIQQMVKQGTSPNDIAIFFRINAMSRPFEEAFIRCKIPYQIVRGVEFYNRKEIRDILAYMKVLVNPDDQTALQRIINTPVRGIGKTTTDRVLAYAAKNNISFCQALKQVDKIDTLSKAPKAKIAVFMNMIEQFKKCLSGSVSAAIEHIFTESGLEVSLASTDIKDQAAHENVKELINAAALYEKDAEEPSLLDYLQQISLFSDTDVYDASAGQVALMTLHAAKGLEFENVFIVGVEEGILPHERSSESFDEIEEERRLLFVGITRAKSRLNISYTKYRTIRGMQNRTIASQFLYELGIDFGRSQTSLNLQQELDYTQSQVEDYELTESASFKKGKLVFHETFGHGRIKEFIDMGADSIAIVTFNTGQTKKIMLKYTKLLTL